MSQKRQKTDWELARELDREINMQRSSRSPVIPGYMPANIVRSNDLNLNSTQYLVHDEWELKDPTPDVHALFKRFDDRFFKNKLICVQLEWSKRMYNCAGICYLRSNRHGKECTIRLSEPLLKLRPRKDLVETLLHEMIHAYCFVQGIREGNGGHGPTFLNIMNNINRVAGTNISVYHNFHDEVRIYKTHVWRCNGICQHRGPFYGYVRRTMNREPGKNDYWWTAHQQSCGGYFEKIKEPEKPQSSQAKKVSAKPKTPKTPNTQDIRNFFTPSPEKASGSTPEEVRSNVKDVWNKRFPESPGAKRPRSPVASTSRVWEKIDDDVFIEDPMIPTITLDDTVGTPNVRTSTITLDDTLNTPDVVLTPQERQTQIRNEILESIGDSANEVIELIDDEYDDNDSTTINNILDESVIEDLFGKDTLMEQFKKNNPTTKTDASKELITCPVCEQYLTRDVMSSHMEGCLGIIDHVKFNVKAVLTPKFKKPKTTTKTLRKPSSTSSSSESNSSIINISADLVPCPVCNEPIKEEDINVHLDLCLWKENSGE